MDEILALLVRLLGQLLGELLLGRIFYFIGWPFVKLATLGKYPSKRRDSHSRQEIYVVCVGIAVSVVALMASLGQFAF
jgi:hypothetical protein